MDANFGIIMLREEREALLTPLPPEKRFWGEEEYIIGELRYQYMDYIGINFQLYQLTSFILNQIPISFRNKKLEYAWLCGPELDSYESILSNYVSDKQHPVERLLTSLLGSLSFWAVMFAPQGERLDQILFLDTKEVVELIRISVSSISDAKGFLAICKFSVEP